MFSRSLPSGSVAPVHGDSPEPLPCLLQKSSSWQDVVTVSKLKLVTDRLPSCPWKGTYRVMDDSVLHQDEEEDPVLHLYLFLT